MLLDSTGGGAFRGRFATGSCHLDGFDGLGLAISALSLFCSATPEFPFFCLGVNVAVTGMCVLAIFTGTRTSARRSARSSHGSASGKPGFVVWTSASA